MTYGRDASAAFLNPATAVLIDDNRLSFSVNFYAFSLNSASHWYRPGPIDRNKFGDLSIDDPSQSNFDFDTLPSSLCIFLRAGQVPFLHAQKDPRTRYARLGICFAQIHNESYGLAAEGFNEQHNNSATRQAHTVAQKYVRFAAGPTYAMYINNAFSLGASVHFGLVTHRNLMQATATTFGTSSSPISSSFYNSSRGTAFNLDATIGATMRFGKQSVGVSLKSPAAHIYGSGGINQQSAFEGSGSATTLTTARGSFVAHEPVRIGIGTGLEGKWGLFEFDTMYSMPLGEAYEAELDGTQSSSSPQAGFSDRPISLALSQQARGVVNFSTGIEVFMSPKISALMGLSTDFSAAPKGAIVNKQGYFNYYPARTSRVAGSFGISSRGEGGEIMIGGELSLGWGERVGINSYQLPPTFGTTGQSIYQLMIVIAGSTSFRNIKRAVDDVKKVVTDPTPLAPVTKPTPQTPLIVTPPAPQKESPPPPPPEKKE